MSAISARYCAEGERNYPPRNRESCVKYMRLGPAESVSSLQLLRRAHILTQLLGRRRQSGDSYRFQQSSMGMAHVRHGESSTAPLFVVAVREAAGGANDG
jgi:hypothetical protein